MPAGLLSRLIRVPQDRQDVRANKTVQGNAARSLHCPAVLAVPKPAHSGAEALYRRRQLSNKVTAALSLPSVPAWRGWPLSGS